MRKSIFATFTAAVAVAAALLLTGCERAIDMTGKPVSFAAGISDGASGPKTRVAYGAEESNYQALDWQEDDSITIYCEACEDKKIAMYEVQDIEKASADVMYSYAGLVNAESDGAGLRWGTGDHTFYAVYPKADGTGTTINGKDITGVIPATQGFTEVSGTDDQIVAPDMKNMYMVSKAGTYESDASPVTLEFKPLTTVLEFTITNQFDDTRSNMNVNSVSLTSESHALSGGFKVNMDEPGRYNRPQTTLTSTVADADKAVTISFGTPVEVAYGKTLTFTFFLNPGNATEVNDLTFVINGTNAGTSEEFTRSAKLEDKTGTGVTIPTHKKTRISGLMVPEGIGWTVNYGSAGDDAVTTVISWDTEHGETGELDLGDGEEPKANWLDLGIKADNGNTLLWCDRNVVAIEDGVATLADDAESYNSVIGAGLFTYEQAMTITSAVGQPQGVKGTLRLATQGEFKSLVNLNGTYDTSGETNGWKLTVGDESIFFPAAGYYDVSTPKYTYQNTAGRYWSSTMATSDPYRFYYDNSNKKGGVNASGKKEDSYSIRLVFEVQPEMEFVDLGLPTSILWANMNIGATAAYEIGDYYPWGETTLWYSALNGTSFTMNSGYSGGFVSSTYASKSNMKDTDKSLVNSQANNDVAYSKSAGQYRMPTQSDFNELIGNCYVEYVTKFDNILIGGLVFWKAQNDADKGKFKSIDSDYEPVGTYTYDKPYVFFPLSGYGHETTLKNTYICYFWSSTRSSNDDETIRKKSAACVKFYSTKLKIDNSMARIGAMPVRPVKDAAK